MCTVRADILLPRWQRMREQLFSNDIKIAILNKLQELGEEDYYLDLRSTSQGYVLALIDQLISLPPGEWDSTIRCQPLTVLAFLYDRILYAEAHLRELGQAEVANRPDDRALLEWGVTDLWDQRDTKRHP